MSQIPSPSQFISLSTGLTVNDYSAVLTRWQIFPLLSSSVRLSPYLTGPCLQLQGATTFRLQAHGVKIFHDTWLEKPRLMKRYLELDDVQEADYILISHAHFDQ